VKPDDFSPPYAQNSTDYDKYYINKMKQNNNVGKKRMVHLTEPLMLRRFDRTAFRREALPKGRTPAL